MNYRYKLGPGRNKIKCPGCGEKTAVQYIDTVNQQPVNETVCKCDRAINCGYHLPPHEYFAANPDTIPAPGNYQPLPPKQNQPLAYIPTDVLKSSLRGYDENTFVQYLNTFIEPETVKSLIDMYKIGSSKRWVGACIFWFITSAGHVKAGQIKKFDSSGHTDTYFSNKESKYRKCTEFVHLVLKYQHEKQNTPLPGWLKTYIERGDYCNTLYGEHLLNQPGNEGKPVAIVEAPKTAIIAAAFMPQYVWLAFGGLSYFTEQRIQVLRGRTVYLFPDLAPDSKAFNLWQCKAAEYSHVTRFHMIDILERIATPEQRAHGYDLADFLAKDGKIKRSFINEFLSSPDAGDDEQRGIVAKYLNMGMSKQAIKEAIDTLINEHGFAIA